MWPIALFLYATAVMMGHQTVPFLYLQFEGEAMMIPVDPLLPLGPTARTTPLRIRPLMLPGIALLAILAIGLAASLYSLFVKSDELPSGTESWSRVAGGETTASLSQFLQKENPLEDPLVTFDRVSSYVLTGDLGQFVRRGCGNWLFLTDELVLRPGRTESFANHVHHAAAFEQIDLALLKDDPFLLFPRETAPTLYDTVVDACRKAGFEPIIGQFVPHMASIVNLVAAELGVSIVPASMMQVRVTGIAYRQIAGQSPTTQLALAYRRGATSPVLRNFIARAVS